MPEQTIPLGHARIAPDGAVVAGSYETITYTYTAGHPIDDSGYLKIAFRFAGDFGAPQFGDPAAPNFCAVRTTGHCHIMPRWDPKGHTRPWGRALYLKVTGGYLDTGEEITIIFGDKAGGSPGWQVQTYCEETFEFKTLVDPIATYEFKELPESPTLRLVAGDPVRAVCIAPSQVPPGTPFTYWLKLEDRWGNPTGTPTELTHPGFEAPGVETVRATDSATELAAESNPINVTAAESSLNLYWADFHGQSEETIGSNTIDDYFCFARDYARLDIASHQGNDFQVTDELWGRIKETATAFNEAGRFVTFAGYEWSGNTPLGGDRNIYFAGETGDIVHSCADLLPGKRTEHAIAMTAQELFAELAGQEDAQPFAFAHIGGRYADMSVHDDEIELAVEIHSAWGTSEWLLEDALRQGHRVGACGNSDGHKGRPGASYPGARKFGSYGGLTCVLAPSLERDAIFTALQARHFYATTGHRCLIDLLLETAEGEEALMGDLVTTKGATAQVVLRVTGTEALEQVLVRNGLETVSVTHPYDEDALQGSSRIKIIWRGAEVRGRERMVPWDGSLHVEGNQIVNIQALNFWNPNRPLERIDEETLAWQSITTGGIAGMILTLQEPAAGWLDVSTVQGDQRIEIATLGMTPHRWEYGGLGKRLEAYRLPRQQAGREIDVEISLSDLQKGRNPIYVRVDQEDGHMAWTSPIYVTRSDG